MATIGTFTASDKAPDYRIFAGSTEFGAAWKKNDGRIELELRFGVARISGGIYVSGGESFRLSHQ